MMSVYRDKEENTRAMMEESSMCQKDDIAEILEREDSSRGCF